MKYAVHYGKFAVDANRFIEFSQNYIIKIIIYYEEGGKIRFKYERGGGKQNECLIAKSINMEGVKNA